MDHFQNYHTRLWYQLACYSYNGDHNHKSPYQQTPTTGARVHYCSEGNSWVYSRRECSSVSMSDSRAWSKGAAQQSMKSSPTMYTVQVTSRTFAWLHNHKLVSCLFRAMNIPLLQITFSCNCVQQYVPEPPTLYYSTIKTYGVLIHFLWYFLFLTTTKLFLEPKVKF